MTDVPRWFGNKRKVNNARSKKQEKDRAQEIGGKAQVGSGSSWRAPQDVRGVDVLEQLKFTDGRTITIDGDRDVRKVFRDGLRSGRGACLVIEFKRYGLRIVGHIEPIPGSDGRRAMQD